MATQIDYYFTSISPFTYLGHDHFLQMAKTAQVKVNFKPVKLAEVFAESGATPMPQRPKCRLKYRLIEIERWAKKRNLPITLEPKYFPTNPTLADKCAIALQEKDMDVCTFIQKALAACWTAENDIADENTLRDILTALNIDADSIVSFALSDEVEAIYSSNTQEAIEQGVLGAPSYILNGEQFWGQDRLELLNESL